MTKRVDRPKLKPGRKPLGPNEHVLFGEGMAELTLANGLKMIIDADDLARVLTKRWIATGAKGHQTPKCRENGKWGPCIARFILDLQDNRAVVDHIDNDTMNNRRSNLRIATPHQNAFNHRKQKNNTTGFVGVIRYRGKIRAQIERMENGKRVSYYLGTFATIEEAAFARDAKAKELHGDFAHINLPPSRKP